MFNMLLPLALKAIWILLLVQGNFFFGGLSKVKSMVVLIVRHVKKEKLSMKK
jgi:hypothetical protein